MASACASVTVVNALATGKGAAFGIDLRVYARVEVGDRIRGIRGAVEGTRCDTRLIETCVAKVLEREGEALGARVWTTSDIPIAVGLSSSSAVANAVVLAAYAALGRKPSRAEVLETGIDAALEAGVTLTGALDDAAASLLGQGVVTNNLERKVLKKFYVPKGLKVAVWVPEGQIYTASLARKRFSSIKEGVEMAHTLALEGRVWQAMMLNGFLYSHALGLDPSPALEALRCGAVAAGLTGTGPAVVAVGGTEAVLKTAERWRTRKGKVILTRPTQKGGRVEASLVKRS
jgi:shikimate kinase